MWNRSTPLRHVQWYVPRRSLSTHRVTVWTKHVIQTTAGVYLKHHVSTSLEAPAAWKVTGTTCRFEWICPLSLISGTWCSWLSRSLSISEFCERCWVQFPVCPFITGTLSRYFYSLEPFVVGGIIFSERTCPSCFFLMEDASCCCQCWIVDCYARWQKVISTQGG